MEITEKRSDLQPIDAVKAAVAWIVTEVGVSITFLLVAAIWLFLALGDATLLTRALADHGFPVLVVATLPAMGILYWVFDRWYRQRYGLSTEDLGYHPTNWLKVVGAGLLWSLLLMAIIHWGTSRFDTFYDEERVRQLTRAGPFVAGLHYLGNAILAPVVEEFAWRGVIQTILCHTWGPGWSVLTTALLFAGKHVAMEGFGRIATLLVVSFTLSIVRERWGTIASTTCHLLLNHVATLWLIHDAFSG